jgi:hypothetical protein
MSIEILFMNGHLDTESIRNMRLVSRFYRHFIDSSITKIREREGISVALPKYVDDLHKCILYDSSSMKFLAGKTVSDLEISDYIYHNRYFSNIKSIDHLTITPYKNAQKTINHICSISSLKSLKFEEKLCKNLDLSQFTALVNLERLYIHTVHEDIKYLTNLRHLTICADIKQSDFIQSLTKLTHLDLYRVWDDTSQLTVIKNLESLTLSFARSFDFIESFEFLTHLRIEYVRFNEPFDNLTATPNLGLAFLRKSTGLVSLRLTEWIFLENDKNILQNMTKLTSLEILNSSNFSQLFPTLKYHTRLEYLDLNSSCFGNIEISTLAKMKDLKYIDISNLCYLKDVYILGTLKKLHTVKLINCLYKTTNFIKCLDELKTLGINSLKADNKNVVSLKLYNIQYNQKIKNCRNVEKLKLYFSKSVIFLNISDKFNALKELFITGNTITDLSAISKLKSLEKLELHFCFTLKNISPLSRLINLKELKFHYCSLENIDPLKNLSDLRILSLFGTGYQLENISSLFYHPVLQSLNVCGCYNVSHNDLLNLCITTPNLCNLYVDELIDPIELGECWRVCQPRHRYIKIYCINNIVKVYGSM